MADAAFGPAARRAAHLAGAALGWAPAQFWAATPAELRTALGLDTEAQSVLDRRALERLMEEFPDG
ncbi:MAG: phage tail assembly chaperone [Polymorphobacter sp.]